LLSLHVTLTVAGWFVPSLVILTAVLTLILVVVIAVIMKRIPGTIRDFACTHLNLKMRTKTDVHQMASQRSAWLNNSNLLLICILRNKVHHFP